MSDAPPTLTRGLPLPAPFFLRQFRAPDAWGDAHTPVEERVTEAVNRGFNVTQPKQSLFLIRHADDLRRVVVGMCAGRQKPTKKPFHFVPFTPAELTAAGITPARVSEDLTGCFVASRELHHDAEADEAALRQLCRNAFGVNRPRVDLDPRTLKALHSTANAEGCPACPSQSRPAPPPCHVPTCLALPTPAPPAAPEVA